MSMTSNMRKALTYGIPSIALASGTLVFFTLVNRVEPDVNNELPVIPTVYDVEASKRKLQAIGTAIGLYREDFGALPAAKRKRLADAGLPESKPTNSLGQPDLERMLIQWRLDRTGERIDFSPPLFATKNDPLHTYTYLFAYPNVGVIATQLPCWGLPAQATVYITDRSAIESSITTGFGAWEMPEILQKWGDRLPILVDFVPTQSKSSDPKRRVLILRLDGSVEDIELDSPTVRAIVKPN